MRVLSNTTLEFADQRIPIALCKATKSTDIKLDTQCPDGSEPRQKLVDDAGRTIARSDIQRGVRVGGKFLRAPESDLDAIERNTAIETVRILEFAPRRTAPVAHITDAYWIKPRIGGSLHLAELAIAIERAQLVAIVKFAIRSKQRLGFIRKVRGGLLINCVAFADEWVPDDDECLPPVEFSQDHLERMIERVNKMRGQGRPFLEERDTAARARRDLVERLVAEQLTETA